MKTFLQIAGCCVIGLLIVSLFMWVTDVPQVYVVSDSIGDGTNPDSWEIKQIKNTEGEIVPHQLWDGILEGRFDLVPVAESWQPPGR